MDHADFGAKGVERSVGGCGVGEPELDEEDVLPRLTGDRPRLDAGKVHASCSQGLQRFHQRSGPVLEREGDAELVRLDSGCWILGSADEMKAGDILRVVFDAAQEDVGTVFVGGELRRQTGGVL